MNFEEIKQQILDFAKAQQVEMDYTAKSIEVLDEIMEIFHEKLNQCSEEEGDAPFQAERSVDIELVESEYQEQNVLYEDVERLLLAVVNGEEEYMILKSADGFLQFLGMNDKFVAETRVNLPDGDFRTYSIINKEKKHATEKITVRTMLSESKIPACKVIALEMLRAAVRAYYSNGQYEAFLKCIPHIDTTDETKRYMGLIK